MIKFWIISNLIALLLLIPYHFLVRNKKSFMFSKVYLISVLIISIIFPSIEWNNIWYQIFPSRDITPFIYYSEDTIVTKQIATVEFWYKDYSTLFLFFKTLVIVIYSLMLHFTMRRLKKMSRAIIRDDITILIHPSFSYGSFSKYMLAPSEDIPPMIFIHEAAHIKSGHFDHKITFTVLAIFTFPLLAFFYVRNEWLLINEYEADVAANKNTEEYSILLLQETLNTKNIFQQQSFYNHPLKQRINMLYQNKKAAKWTTTLITIVVLITAISLNVHSKINDAELVGKITNEKMKDSLNSEGTNREIMDSDSIYRKPHTRPDFPGGFTSFSEYLMNNLNYPDDVEVEGRIPVTFVIERDGSITNAKVLKSIHPSLDKEALRVITSSPKWIPGKDKNGNPVRVHFIQMITFKR